MSCRRTASLLRTHTSGVSPTCTGRRNAGRIASNNSRESILKHRGPHHNHALTLVLGIIVDVWGYTGGFTPLRRQRKRIEHLVRPCFFFFRLVLRVLSGGLWKKARRVGRSDNDRCAANITGGTTIAAGLKAGETILGEKRGKRSGFPCYLNSRREKSVSLVYSALRREELIGQHCRGTSGRASPFYSRL